MTPHESTSNYCRRTKEQNCHVCEDASCSDNTTPSIVNMRLRIKALEGDVSTVKKEMKREVKRAEEERDRVAESFHNLAERFSDLENAVMNGIIIFGGKATPLKEMVDAVKAAKTIGGEDER